jgi:hypothetical protein
MSATDLKAAAIYVTVFIVACTVIFISPSTNSARAAETPPEAGVPERLDQLEKKLDAPALWRMLGFKLSGLLDVAYTQNFHNPASDLNQARSFDTNANAFMPHLFQLMV